MMINLRPRLLTAAQREQFTRSPWLDERTLSRYHLKRAVAFHRSGEIRDRSFDAQSNRASGLNPVTTAIVVWITVYLGRVAETLRAEGRDVPDELVAHVSPLGWEHIGLTGDYVW